MVTLRTYQCNFCRQEYSSKKTGIDDIIGVKWETQFYSGTPYDKSETIEILKEVNKENAENHLCKKCIKVIKEFTPNYLKNKPKNKSKTESIKRDN